MSFVYDYSGVLAAIVALIFIVIPTFFAKIDYHREPISYVTRKKIAGRVFRGGLVVTALLLFTNTVRMVQCFDIQAFSVGEIVYLMGTACMILVALIDIDFLEDIHTACTKEYFLLSVIGEVGISIDIFHSISIPLVIAVVGGGGTLFLYYLYGMRSQAEYWGIMCAILWVLVFYVL